MDLDLGPRAVNYSISLPVTDFELTPSAEDNEGSPIHTAVEPAEKIPAKGCFDFFKVEWHLVKFKSFFFFFGGAIGAVFPYFSVYYKQLGLSPNQIGIISGLRPIIGFCSGPLWGSLADRFRIRRIVLFCSALGWLAFITAIGFVPSANISEGQCPYVYEFLGKNVSYTNTSSTTNTDVTREDFFELHRDRHDVSPEESLMESRGWIYDSTGLYRVYIFIMILVVLGELVQSPCGALADSGCIETLGNTNMHKYGHQRAWGSLGLGIMSVVVGGIISTTRKTKVICDVRVVFSNYHVAFFFFAACMFFCTVNTFFFKFQLMQLYTISGCFVSPTASVLIWIYTVFLGSRKCLLHLNHYRDSQDCVHGHIPHSKQVDDHNSSKPRPNPFKVFRMFLTFHYGSWLFCMFVTGICNGVIWGFLFWHLENLGATQLVLGLANGTSLFSEMCMFVVVFRIIEKTGCLVFMALGLLGYTIRFIVFAVIDNPWLVLPFEVLQGFTFAGIWSVFTKYLCANVPFEYLGTLQGFLHGVYWGLGNGTGHMIGGISVETLGARMTFWIFAGASFFNFAVFLIIQKCTKKPNVFGNYEELDEKAT